ncbi:MAG: ATP-binding protein, partial [Pseudomonadota bacterium]
RLMRANQTIEVQKQQSTKRKLDTAVSFGTAILGAVLGRKKISSSSASKMGTAIKTASSARKEAADVKRAQEVAAKVKTDMAELEQSLQLELDELDTKFDAQTEELSEIVVRAKSTDIHVAVTGLVWLPYTPGENNRLRPAW